MKKSTRKVWKNIVIIIVLAIAVLIVGKFLGLLSIFNQPTTYSSFSWQGENLFYSGVFDMGTEAEGLRTTSFTKFHAYRRWGSSSYFGWGYVDGTEDLGRYWTAARALIKPETPIGTYYSLGGCAVMVKTAECIDTTDPCYRYAPCRDPQCMRVTEADAVGINGCLIEGQGGFGYPPTDVVKNYGSLSNWSKNRVCKAYGTFDTGETYDVMGSIGTYSGSDYGIACILTNEDTSKYGERKIVEGKVEFMLKSEVPQPLNCGWCGGSCSNIKPDTVCIQIAPPLNKQCVESAGSCIIQIERCKEDAKDYATCANGNQYLKARCISGEWKDVSYSINPCLTCQDIKETCPDGTEITTKKCVNNALVDTGQACPSGKCPIAVPLKPCEDATWMDVPDCKWNESTCKEDKLPISFYITIFSIIAGVAALIFILIKFKKKR